MAGIHTCLTFSGKRGREIEKRRDRYAKRQGDKRANGHKKPRNRQKNSDTFKIRHFQETETERWKDK
jgi:hypothetical protein